MFFCLFCAIFDIFGILLIFASFWAHILGANFSGSKFCQCCFVSFFHLCQTKLTYSPTSCLVFRPTHDHDKLAATGPEGSVTMGAKRTVRRVRDRRLTWLIGSVCYVTYWDTCLLLLEESQNIWGEMLFPWKIYILLPDRVIIWGSIVCNNCVSGNNLLVQIWSHLPIQFHSPRILKFTGTLSFKFHTECNETVVPIGIDFGVEYICWHFWTWSNSFCSYRMNYSKNSNLREEGRRQSTIIKL